MESWKHPFKEYYKIMDWSEKGIKTLFHANGGSRIIPIKKWVYAHSKLVSDGSSGTKYMSGWHVLDDLEETKKYLFSNFKNLDNKIIVNCFCMGDIRPKLHSRANVWLCNIIWLDEIMGFGYYS